MSVAPAELHFVLRSGAFRRRYKPSIDYIFKYAKAELSPDAKFCSAFLDRLERIIRSRGSVCEIFLHPLYDDHEYLSVVKKPVTIRELKNNIVDGRYSNRDQFKRDIDLLWNNFQHYSSDPKVHSECSILREKSNELWALLTALESAPRDLGKSIRDKLRRVKQIAASFRDDSVAMDSFRFPSHRLQKLDEERPRPRPRPKVDDDDDDDDIPKTAMEHREKLELAIKLDVLPLYHLYEVLRILDQEVGNVLELANATDNQQITIPFSRLSHSTLRRIERYVKNIAKDQQKGFSEPPERLKVMLEEDLKAVDEKLKEKLRAPDTTSENETGTEASETSDGDSDESDSDD